MRKHLLSLSFTAGIGILLLAGCSIHESHSRGEDGGKKENVDIKTPFGSISVREGDTDVKATGLTPYPGARIKSDSDNHHGNANVNISSSLFGVKVVAVKYQSSDPADKVLGFYRKDMGRYGNVVDCSGHFNFSMKFHHHDKDAEVTCDDDHDSSGEYRQELKVGTRNNQRVVAIKPSGDGSEFTLVYVRAWGDDKEAN